MQLVIYHTNDLHGQADSFARLGKKIADADLVFDAGDALRGSNSIFYPREPVLELMNQFGYTAMCLGNREFHYFRSVIIQRVKSVNFPILTANLVDRRKILDKWLTPCLTKEIKGLKIKVIGLTIPNYFEGHWVEKINGMFFVPAIQRAKEIVKEIDDGSSLIIVLSHLGLEEDKKLAQELPVIDLIIGGHSHTPMEEPLKEGKTLIVQAGAFASSLGKLVLEVEKNRINNYRGFLLWAKEE